MNPRDRIQTGEDLELAREQLGFSVADLAKALRMTGYHALTHLREMERSTRNISGPVAVAVGYMLEEAETRQ